MWVWFMWGVVQEYSDVVGRREPHLLLDVREEVEYHICHLPHSRSIPLCSMIHIIYSVMVLTLADMPLRQLESGSVEEVWQWIQEARPSRDDCC